MGNGVSVHVVVQNPSVKSGGNLVGTIFVHLKESIQVTGVRLELNCTEESGAIGATKSLLKHVSILKTYETGGKALFSGHYAYPFTLELPGCPGSFNAPLPDVIPNIKYELSGVIVRAAKVLAKHSIILNVIPSHPVTIEPLLETVRKTTGRISCFGKAAIELTVMTDKNLYRGGEQVTVTLNVKNETKSVCAPVSVRLCRLFIADEKVYRDDVDTIALSTIEPGRSLARTVTLHIPKEFEYLKAQLNFSGNVHVIYHIEAQAGAAQTKIPVHIDLPAAGEPNDRPNDGENWHPVEHKHQICTVPGFTGSVRYNNERGRPGSMQGGSSYKAKSFVNISAASMAEAQEKNKAQMKKEAEEVKAVDKKKREEFTSAEDLDDKVAKSLIAAPSKPAPAKPAKKELSPMEAMLMEDSKGKGNNVL